MKIKVFRKYHLVIGILIFLSLVVTGAWGLSSACNGGAKKLTSIEVTPATPSVAAGATQQFVATATYSDGSTADITVTVTWGSSDETVAAFEAPTENQGLASTLSAGVSTVSATDTDTGIVGSTDITVAALSGTANALYSTHGVNWNDYVLNDGANIFTATNTVCNPATAGTGYNACINGGLLRMVEVTGQGVCDNLTATDSLGVFNWVCDSSTNDVRMVTVGFAEGKGLSDLIDFDAAAWKQLNVTVYLGANPYLVADMSNLWGNPIVVNNNGAAQNEGEIHIVTADPVKNYTIGANKVSLLVKPGLIMNGANTPGNVITAAGKNFIWLEGIFDAKGDEYGIKFDSIKFSQIRNVKVQNASSSDKIGLHLLNSANNRLAHVTVANNGESGVYLENSDGNLMDNFEIFNNGYSGLSIWGGGTDNVIVGLTTFSNDTEGVYISNNSNSNVLLNVTSPNNDDGVYMNANANKNSLMNIISMNASVDGFYLNTCSNNIFANVVSAYSNTNGWRVNNSTDNCFNGKIMIGNNSTNCNVVAPPDPGIDTNCNPTSACSDFGSPTTVNLADSFVAKVSTDTANANGATGTKKANDITDWLNFENKFRGWGINGSAFPNNDNVDFCDGAETCRIWDWSLASADDKVRNILSLPTGNDTLEHEWSNTTKTKFLRNAVEILEDGIGNENGLCESNETCLFTPNIGSYQGHGSLVSAGDFTDGTITGVTLLKYKTNGR